jgi:hypothetical protein
MENYEDTIPQPEEILFPFQDQYPEIQDWILDDIIQWIEDLGNRVYNWFTNLLSQIISYFYSVRDYIISSLSSLVNNVWINLQSQFFGLSNYLSNIWNKLYSIGSEIVSSVSQYISQIISYIQNSICPFLNQILSNIGQMATQVYNTITSNLGQFAQSFLSWIQQIGSSIQGGLSWLWDNITGWFNSMIASIKDVWGNTSEWLKNTWDQIIQIPEKVGNFLASELDKIGDKLKEWLEKDVQDAVEHLEGAETEDQILKGSPFWAVLVRVLAYIGPILLALLKKWGPRIAIFGGILALEKTGKLEDLVEEYVTPAFQETLRSFESLGPIGPLPGGQIVTSITKAITATMTGLSMFVLAGGFMGLFKQVGLGTVAAMLYDVTNFRTLTASFMTALATVYIIRPVTYYYNNIARPNIPREGDVMRLAGEYAIDKATFMELMGYHGYPEYWADRLYELADTPARYFALRAIADTGYWDEDFFEFELKNSGYNERTIPILKDMLRRYSKGEAKGYGITTVMKRYREGIIGEDQFKSELEILGIPEEKHSLFKFVADLDYQYDFASDMIAAYREQVRRGMIDTGTFRQQLIGLGIRPDKVEAYVLREEARMFKPPKVKPTPEPVPYYLTDEGSIKMKAEIEAFRRNLIDASELYARLINLQMEPGLAEAYVDYENIKKTKPSE